MRSILSAYSQRRRFSAGSLQELAADIVRADDVRTKALLAAECADLWRKRAITVRCSRGKKVELPELPGRPEKPELLVPKKCKFRPEVSSLPVYVVHAVAHIEVNAMDLYADSICRATESDLPEEFFDDFVNVLADETRHFVACITHTHAF
ncbi:MAG: hypothetical protein MHM6MM_006864 [Cercozoa sp. M6MM]